jgi:hypothetical protein
LKESLQIRNTRSPVSYGTSSTSIEAAAADSFAAALTPTDCSFVIGCSSSQQLRLRLTWLVVARCSDRDRLCKGERQPYRERGTVSDSMNYSKECGTFFTCKYGLDLFLLSVLSGTILSAGESKDLSLRTLLSSVVSIEQPSTTICATVRY